jgi:hypothetical protein
VSAVCKHRITINQQTHFIIKGMTEVVDRIGYRSGPLRKLRIISFEAVLCGMGYKSRGYSMFTESGTSIWSFAADLKKIYVRTSDGTSHILTNTKIYVHHEANSNKQNQVMFKFLK